MKTRRKIFLMLAPTFCYQLFEYRAIPVVVLKMSGFLTSFLLFILSLKQIFLKHYKAFSIPWLLRAIIIQTLFTFIIAALFWNQPFPNTFRSSICFFNLSFFFLLLKYKAERNFILKLVLAYTVIEIILLLYAFSAAPIRVFGLLGEDGEAYVSDERGGYRLSIAGKTIATIAYFYFLGKAFVKEKRKRLVCISISILLLIFNCSSLTRSNMASIFVVTVYVIYCHTKNKIKFLALLACSIIAITFIFQYFFQEQYETMLDLTETQFSYSGGKDIMSWSYRIYEYIFFFTEYNQSVFTYIFGNGMPNNSPLQDYEDFWKMHGYWASDVSYAMIFKALGLVGLILYITLIVKALRLKVSKENRFCKSYILYAAVSTITISNLLDSIPLCACLYLIYKDNQEPLKTQSKHEISQELEIRRTK